jgi:hypothetical protein
MPAAMLRSRDAPFRDQTARGRGRWDPPPAWVLGMMALVLAMPAGCSDDVRATLVALRGCGLEEEPLASLRVVPRGDFPLNAIDDKVVRGGTLRLPAIPDDATGITVEGFVGDFVEAVGRTPRLDDPEGPMPVYFAPPGELCVVHSGVDFREVGGMAVGPGGDIVVVGGRDRFGRLLHDVIHTRDDVDVVTPLDRGLAEPLTGAAVVPTGARSFAVIGGARQDSHVLDAWVPIDFELTHPVRPYFRLDAVGVDDVARAYHAAAVLPDGRVMVTGGCAGNLALDASCDTTAGLQKVLANSYFVDPSTDPPTVTDAPSLQDPRFDHQMFVARDGAVFVVGGRTLDGGASLGIERWWPGSSSWRTYGKRAGELDIEDNGPISGAALLEGGLFVIAFQRGALGWIDETAAGTTPAPAILGADPERPDDCASAATGGGYWGGWCDGDPETRGCLFTEGVCPSPSAGHRVIALPDERVMVDTWLLPFPQLATGSNDAIDLAQMKPGESPPGRRTEATLHTLADGTVLIAGGRDPDTLEPADAFLLRLRPELTGPDENIPALDLAGPGGFVLHDPVNIERVDERIVLHSTQPDDEAFPAVWTHVRSFRSASFRFEATLRGDSGGVPYLVLSQGAITRATLRFGAGVELLLRNVAGHGDGSITCDPPASGPFSAQELALRVDVRPESIVVRAGGTIIARCPGVGDVQSAIGVGVAGSVVDTKNDDDVSNDERVMGTLTVGAVRVTRI